MAKQLCINRLDFPHELIDIIKSYVFLDIVSHLSKTRKHSIDRLIESSKWTNEFYYFRSRIYNCVICIGEDTKCPEFLINFCSKCGNYKSYRSNQNQKVNCRC